MRQLQSPSAPPPSSTPAPPPRWQVAATGVGAVVSMAAAVYFAGQQLTPIALVGTTLFVGLGGLCFELARRRAQAAARSS